MSDCFITRRGGSGLFAFAYIYATIPADSTATCVCGQVSATPYLLDSRHIIFKVPSVGTWVVSTIPVNPEWTKSVVISTQGQVEEVIFREDIVLYDGAIGGYINPLVGSFSGTYFTDKGTYLYINTSSDKVGHLWCTSALQRWGYHYMHFTFSAASTAASNSIGITSTATGTNFIVSQNVPSGGSTQTVDISLVDQPFYIGFSSYRQNAISAHRITRIWMSNNNV